MPLDLATETCEKSPREGWCRVKAGRARLRPAQAGLQEAGKEGVERERKRGRERGERDVGEGQGEEGREGAMLGTAVAVINTINSIVWLQWDEPHLCVHSILNVLVIGGPGISSRNHP